MFCYCEQYRKKKSELVENGFEEKKQGKDLKISDKQ
jgi:hypothetical protein